MQSASHDAVPAFYETEQHPEFYKSLNFNQQKNQLEIPNRVFVFQVALISRF